MLNQSRISLQYVTLYISFACEPIDLISQGPSKPQKLNHEPFNVVATVSTSEVQTNDLVEVSTKYNSISMQQLT
jgi:hypothetical protein